MAAVTTSARDGDASSDKQENGAKLSTYCPRKWLSENSVLSMEGVDAYAYRPRSRASSYDFLAAEDNVTSMAALVRSLDFIFSHFINWPVRKEKIEALLKKVSLTTDEANKYTFWDIEKAYTRNLVHTDSKHYTLLLLCWNPGRESSIHNHPCDGCFVKTIRGCVKETRYTTHEETQEVRQHQVRFYNEGQVSFMSDEIGLHKIGNPNREMGSVSLHLYTPPFKSCNVWQSPGVGVLKQHEEGKMGFFSVLGHRSPNLEGKPGRHAKLMEDILAHFKAIREAKEQGSDAEQTSQALCA